MSEGGEPVLNFNIQVPSELETGVFADFLSVWHSPHDFTLDFGVTLQAEASVAEGGGQRINVPCRIVARVKIPLTLAQDVLRAMSENVSQYEETAGTIRRPGDDKPTYPPEELT